MNLQLTNKTALVTASTAGIGFAIAEGLLKEGASVIVNGRTKDTVNKALSKLTATTGSQAVQGFIGDLTQQQIREDLFREFPKVDILVNNLGVYESKKVMEIKPEDWSEMFDTNVVSSAVISQFYLKGMLKQNWGRILMISSETGVNVPDDMIHYGVSKAAQIALARGLAETTRGTKVTVNSILPGPTLSEGVSHYLEAALKGSHLKPEALQRDFIEKLRPTSLIQRFAKSEEVANLVTYIASELSSATNGASLRVEGGLLRNV